MQIVCISDTHGQHRKLKVPDGDLLIHAGDFSDGRGSLSQVFDFALWLRSLPHKYKVCVAGNHDYPLQDQAEKAEAWLSEACTYLRDRAVVIEGLKIYGSPWQPEFCAWAFNLPRRGRELAEKWAAIPDDTDILVTHGPAFGLRDRTDRGHFAGCELLRERLPELGRLRLHVFGHIHEGAGSVLMDGVQYANASQVDIRYRLLNAPIVVDLVRDGTVSR